MRWNYVAAIVLGALLVLIAGLALWAPVHPGAFLAAPDTDASGLPLDTISLPDGFSIEVYARIPGARSLRYANDTVFVGTRSQGKVWALTGDGAERFLIDEGLRSPNGVAYRDGSLYVAEVGRVLRYDDISARLDTPPEPVVVTDAYPEDAHHGWKYIRFGPDGSLYVPVGAPCNVCLPGDPYAAITRLNVSTGEYEVVARGVRNTVGFDWHPDTGGLWFTDNGRDLLGEDTPPDELNRVSSGSHFGFPFCHGTGVQDPEFDSRSCGEFAPPVLELGPHVAALGMEFYTAGAFPEVYRGDVFVAEHGSWNRRVPIGYRVMHVSMEGSSAVSYEPFATGWLRGSSSWGRPVDVEALPDGSLLVSDDKAGAVYRIRYQS